MVIGKRNKRNTIKLVKDLARRTNNKIPNLITSDEYKPYSEALLEVYGFENVIEKQKGRGRPPKTKKEIVPNLIYAIVRKYRRKGRVVDIQIKVKYGTREELEKVLSVSKISKHVNTSFVERYNSTDRQMSSRKRRKSYTYSKEFEYHESVSWFIICFYNFCRNHHGLRVKLDECSKSKHYYQTPAMASGIVNHKLSIPELLNIRV